MTDIRNLVRIEKKIRLVDQKFWKMFVFFILKMLLGLLLISIT